MLKFAKERGITVAGFLMEGEYSILHYWDMGDRYREKGLKPPLGNQEIMLFLHVGAVREPPIDIA